MDKPKAIVTFKVDPSISQLLEGISNRSEFIRTAILSALDNRCPFCKGTGVLNAKRKKHWKQIKKHHAIRSCRQCHEMVIVCQKKNKV